MTHGRRVRTRTLGLAVAALIASFAATWLLLLQEDEAAASRARVDLTTSRARVDLAPIGLTGDASPSTESAADTGSSSSTDAVGSSSAADGAFRVHLVCHVQLE